ncbi:MAG: tripartite tricarboxylate transporter substrate binding protein [Betaproteobacteria bacterium]|nr:tripartite tricarboxylate transporter substrate binding protein [Betaproteobacteria bacterium]
MGPYLPFKPLMTALISALATGGAHAAENFPLKPVRMVVPFPVSGATDILARVVSQKLSEQWRHQVIVDNRPGAGGTLGSRILASGVPDGYTLLLGTTSTHAIGPYLYSQRPYDPLTDFSGITQVATSPMVMMVASQVPAQSLQEFIALAKARPGKLNFGSSGIGTQFHLSGELLKLIAGINIVHVPYKGTALVYPEMFAGQIQMLFDLPIVALPFIKQGRVRPLGVGSAKRAAVLPDVPTMAEAGIPGFDADLWFGLFAPAKMAKERLARIHGETVRALNAADVKERLATLGADPVGNTPEAFSVFLRAENAKWEKVVKASGARAD